MARPRKKRPVLRGDRGRFLKGTRPGPGRPKKEPPAEPEDPPLNPYAPLTPEWFQHQLRILGLIPPDPGDRP